MSQLIEQTIRESPLFKHLDAAWLDRLVQSATMQPLASGAVVIQENSVVQHLYILLSGRVRVWVKKADRDIELKILGPGSYFGEVSLLSGKNATATVEVKGGDAELMSIPRDIILELVQKDEKVRRLLQGVTMARAKDTIEKFLK